MRHLSLRVGALLTLLLGIGLLLAGPASAHATIATSSPVDGARFKSAPATVSITFDESVGLGSLGYLHVINQSGTRVESGSATHPNGDDSTIEVALQHGLPDGTYTESYRVISADSHPVAGVVRFVVGNGPLVTAAVPGADGSTTVNHVASVALVVSRWISWAGLAVLGGAWLLFTTWPAGRDERRARRLVWAGWGAAALGGLLELLVQGPYTAGVGLAHLFDPSLVDATLHTTYGQWHSARLLLLGVAALLVSGVLYGRARLLELGAPLGLAIAFSYAATGHAETTQPRWISLLLDTLHLSSMAVWVGGLAMLLVAVLPRRDPEELDTVLPVFSRVAFGAVVVLAASGTYAAWRGIGSLRAITHTEYGLLVLGKIVLFIGLLSVGNLSRRVVQHKLAVAYAVTDDPVEAPHDLRAERLRRSVLVEIALAVFVLVLTAVLVGQPRGAEALAAQDREPVMSSASLGDGRTASVMIDPGEHGTVSVDVSVTGGTPPKTVTATAALPSQQLGPIPLSLASDGGAHYSTSGVELPVAGDWIIALVVTSSQFDAVTADIKIHLS